VLAGAELDAAPGAVTLVEGANGAGKTTLLRIFATVVRPDAGTVHVDGLDVVRDGARVRERIGVAFVNERSLFWRLSGRENLELFARTRGVARGDVARQVDGLLEELALGAIAPRPVANLSAGQRQRLVVARAGLGDPRVLLIDEPLRGLDDAGIAATLAFLRQRARGGATVLVVAPKADELAGEADALLALDDGVLAPVGQRERAPA
jgi:ABC-type multidrug transport system ATPase subunit